ncbi:MAG: hypothetical protein A2545_08445 [Planctomycetes bacterium RIFOXYD2_FULL_41_16]|nr:MAG: hypothetical protein A2094_03095 [Planctomycetes bacterium GWE2_41_14]OHC06210.1 MAG: hypothetical protein A3K50_06475 [Planctomycetes bacterium RIFOXYD12_FULL_42_12]OHC07817.1 MAG: hypothetical protein A2545_08445 [Planctomycetes bacterium RIFOXYD2_FULL_41_16]
MRAKHPYIVSIKTHCGGSPVIAGTKFPVRSVVFYILRQGMTPEEFVKEFSHLSLSQVYDALSYYYENRGKIDKELSLRECDLKIQAMPNNV